MKKPIPLPGQSADTAIKLNATSSEDAIQIERQYLERIYGVRDLDWTTVMQALVQRGPTYFDRITIQIGRRQESIFFDITSVFPPVTEN